MCTGWGSLQHDRRWRRFVRRHDTVECTTVPHLKFESLVFVLFLPWYKSGITNDDRFLSSAFPLIRCSTVSHTVISPTLFVVGETTVWEDHLHQGPLLYCRGRTKQVMENLYPGSGQYFDLVLASPGRPAPAYLKLGRIVFFAGPAGPKKNLGLRPCPFLYWCCSLRPKNCLHCQEVPSSSHCKTFLGEKHFLS